MKKIFKIAATLLSLLPLFSCTQIMPNSTHATPGARTKIGDFSDTAAHQKTEKDVSLNDKIIKPENNFNESEAEYVSGTEDVPLLAGLTQIKDGVTNFDTMTGNIVISTYTGKMNLNEAKKFYLETMPQLGWKLDFSSNDKLSYKRKSDNLEIFLKKEKQILLVKFFVSSSL